VNFVLSRAWAYRDRHEGAVASQAWRYALVAVGGAALNAALLAFLLSRVGGPYLLARVAVSAGVSLLYTYPLHARFVFRVRT
jgi:putative flippase GtrA